MNEKEKPQRSLPRPPKTPFGGNRSSFGSEDATDSSLLADKLAMAAAEGRLEDFLNSQLPDSEQARALAMMMLSMSGMAEHQSRSAISEMSPKEMQNSRSSVEPTVQEKELIDKLIAIASDNNTTVDWLIMRALRIYIQDYERTGRL